MKNWFRIWILPGAAFQSILVGGGYGTGREVVEFISRFGPMGGLLAVLLVGILMSVLLAVTFEISRRFQILEYRGFFKILLGQFWVVYEVVFILALVLVLAVTGSAAGALFQDSFGLSAGLGIGLMLFIIVLFNYFGRQWVENSLAIWGLMMSVAMVAFVLLTVVFKGEGIAAAFESEDTVASIHSGWWLGGLMFFLYNIFVAPAVLYTTEYITTRRQAIGAGAIAGIFGVFPGIAFHLAFMADYPGILEQVLPTYSMINQLDLSLFLCVYLVLLFGTIVQTGVGVLQGINERLDAWWRERQGKSLEPRIHAAVAGLAVLASMLLADVGIVALVSRGYGSLAWFSLAIYVLPVLTLGVWKLWSTDPK